MYSKKGPDVKVQVRTDNVPTGTNRPRLKIAIGTYGHTSAIKNGSVPIEGVDADFIEVQPIIQAFRRMVRDVEFDICEMAPTTYMIARALGAPYIALPIFVMRRFHHGGFIVRPDANIKQPKDLEGKKVGVRAYSVTTGVWTSRNLRQRIRPRFIQSNLGGGRRGARHHAQTAAERRSRPRRQIAAEHDGVGRNPCGFHRSGRCWPRRPANWQLGHDRADRAAAGTYPELIANVEQVEADWFRRTGIYPIHGLIVVKDEHIKRYPWLARSLMNAFVTSKKPYLEGLKLGRGDSAEDKRYRGFFSLMSDPLPHGMAANRPSIDALVTYALQQELIPSRPQLDQVFVDIDP